MSIICYEAAGSPKPHYTTPSESGGSTDERVYVVLGTSDEIAAANAALAIAPLFLNTVNPGEVLIRTDATPAPIGPTAWEVAVKYVNESNKKSQEPPEPGTWHFNFDTTGGSHKITQALETVWKGERSMSNPAPDLQGAIGWDGKKVNGADVPVAKLEFSITAYYAPTAVTTTFMRNLARRTPRTNSDTFLGFDPGELLYVGSSGSGDIPTRNGQRVKPIAITHKYWASENLTDLAVGEITVATKKGWDYLDVRYEMVEESGKLFPVPVHAFVHRIFEEMDFVTFFGFGGS